MKPRLLDLFSGAGGCARGYQRAGFYVVGVDAVEQPRYAGDEFHHGDAMEFPLENFDAIHASPPCQAHSTIGKQVRERFAHIEHKDLVAATRERLEATGLPFVIENVPGAPLKNAITLCGSSFGLNVRRHRLFETNFSIMAPPCAHYWQTPRFRSLDKRRGDKSVVPVHGGGQLAGLNAEGLASVVGVHGHQNYAGERELREWAMDIDWMTPYELTQAIPPAYTEFIGEYLMTEVRNREALDAVA